MDERIALTVSGQQNDHAPAVLSGAMLAGAQAPARSLYIHVPFCFHKCHYCDFYSIVDQADRQGEFTDRLIDELRFLAPHAGRLESVFVGGGTPTLLAVEHWRRLLAAMGELFDCSGIRSGGGEFTIECNPETATPELFDTLVAGGVNRVSVGAQSFDERHLKTLERWHDPVSVGKALAIAKSAGIERRSLDLIFAIPGQTLEDWSRDLETGLSVDPGLEHISCYALTYEPNTAMTMRLKKGEFDAAPEDLEAAMYSATVERLRAAGLERYEVSNFARGEAGRSRHNLAYWRNETWLAAGPSASGHLRCGEAGGWRWKNTPNLRTWMAGVERSGGASPIVDAEAPDSARALCERIMMGIRIAEGLEIESLLAEAQRLGAGDAMSAAIAEQVALGHAEELGGRLRLTTDGFLFADGVAGSLMGAIEGG